MDISIFPFFYRIRGFKVKKLSQGPLMLDKCEFTLFSVHAPMIAVGSDDPNPSAGGKVQIYEYSDNTR